MTEIEKCVCGIDRSPPQILADDMVAQVVCGDCHRAGALLGYSPGDAGSRWAAAMGAIESWNRDQRGLRLLRELAKCHARDGGITCGPEECYEWDSVKVPTELWKQVQDWDEEGDR